MSIMAIVRYRWAAVAYPGLWFSLPWLLAITIYNLGLMLGVYDTPVDTRLNELYLFIIITSATFLIVSLLPRSHKKTKPITPDAQAIDTFDNLYIVMACFALGGAFLDLVLLGLNFGDIEARRQAWLESIPVASARLMYLFMLVYPAAFHAGYKLCTLLCTNITIKRNFLLAAALPFFAGFFWMTANGGRQILGFVLFYYAFGGAIGLVRAPVNTGVQIPLRTFVRIGLVTLGIVLVFAWIVDITYNIRAQYQGLHQDKRFTSVLLSPFSSFLEYVAGPIFAYQIKADLYDPRSIEVGRDTFGIIDQLQLSSLVGWEPLRESEYQSNKQRALTEGSAVFLTGSLFYSIKNDYGLPNGLYCAALLALISHLIFLVFLQKDIHSLVRFVPITFALMFWGYSSQLSLLKYDTLKWMFLSFVAWEFAKRYLLFNGRRTLPRPMYPAKRPDRQWTERV